MSKNMTLSAAQKREYDINYNWNRNERWCKMSPKRRKLRTIIGAGGAIVLMSMLCFAPLFPLQTVYYIQRKHHDQELCYIGSPQNTIEVAAMSRTLHEYGESHFIIQNKILVMSQSWG